MTGAKHRLTPFQEQCIRRLEAALGESGHELQAIEWRSDNPAVSEPGAEFLHARVTSTTVEVWIYDDQADVKVGGDTVVFESEDFRAPDEQITAFITAVLERLRKSGQRGQSR